ncbi:hypothetical protein PROFUN_16178 [Planoprotostelium fungivorum]|uniref:Uncharacterized protein n=1 Tax=Planoprotostelium fungivorum TaxID=1890364 RepID=A0A2P6MR40_9EUKA|nr:hypothetical protein PROFUN_16178 [Planoprotostelium fungivorum]
MKLDPKEHIAQSLASIRKFVIILDMKEQHQLHRVWQASEL